MSTAFIPNHLELGSPEARAWADEQAARVRLVVVPPKPVQPWERPWDRPCGAGFPQCPPEPDVE